MATEMGHTRPVAISAVVGITAVKDRAAAVIIVIGAAVLGRCDRKTGADNAGECGRGRGATAAAVVATPGAEVSGAAGCAAADRPMPAGAEPAKAIEGSTAVSATAATAVSTAARPIDENTPFRDNISMSSVAAWPDRPGAANR